MSHEAIAEAVRDAFATAQVRLLEELVAQPSCTREPEDVEAAFAILDREAEALGLVRSLHPDPSGRFATHRVYATAAAGDGPAIALVGHLDTVFPRAMGFAGFTREGDVARGPGVLDMKSGLTSILFALRALRRASPERFAALRARFVCVSDEEVGSPSSAPLFATLAPRTTAALVFEAGREGDRIVTRRRGGAVFEIEAHGKAAHAGNAHGEGVNAIHGLSLLVPRIEGLTDEARGVSLNVGLFRGGTAKNTVPDHATIEIDGRFVRGEDGPWLLDTLAAIVADPFEGREPSPPRLRALRFALGGGITRPPMEPTERTQALRAAYEARAAAAGLGVGEAPLQGGGSDACLLAAAGVPSLDGLGPYGRHFHDRKEWCSLESLRRRTEALATFLAEPEA